MLYSARHDCLHLETCVKLKFLSKVSLFTYLCTVIAENDKKIKYFKSMLIVGGGLTGMELAGEFVADFLRKRLKLV